MASIEVPVSDEMIEKILKEQIRNKIDKYLNDYNKRAYFENLFREIARTEVRKVITDEFIEITCKQINKNEIVETVTTRISEQIAEAVRKLYDY